MEWKEILIREALLRYGQEYIGFDTLDDVDHFLVWLGTQGFIINRIPHYVEH